MHRALGEEQHMIWMAPGEESNADRVVCGPRTQGEQDGGVGAAHVGGVSATKDSTRGGIAGMLR